MFFKTLKFGLFLGTAIMFGLMSVGKNFSIWFLGSSFEKTGYIVQILSITILFMTIANIIRTQYLIPNEKDKEYTISIVIGAIINLILNLIFIRKYGSFGACIGTIIAEFLVMFFHIYFSNKYIPIFKYLIKNSYIIVKGLIMFIIVKLLDFINIDIFYKIILQTLIGISVYSLLNYSYIVNELKTIDIFKKLKKKTHLTKSIEK